MKNAQLGHILLNPSLIIIPSRPVQPQTSAIISHVDAVHSVVYSTDGSYLLTSSGDASARLWHTISGIEERNFHRPNEPLYLAKLSPNGVWVATASENGKIALWNVEDEQEPQWEQECATDIKDIVFSSIDESILVTHKNTNLEVFSFDGRKLYSENLEYTDDVIFSSYKANKIFIITVNDRNIVQFGINKHPPHLLKVPPEVDDAGDILYQRIDNATLSPNGDYILLDNGQLWSSKTKTLVITLDTQVSQLSAMAFSPDGNWILTGNGKGTAQLWDTASGSEHAVLLGHTDAILSVAFSLDSLWVATGSKDGTARQYDIRSLTLADAELLGG